ncbi:MAG: pyrroline-5-carboxylate reductase [Candidatus Borkfalkiaceae bacterium]|nr:pyrroline-5-carboxylate reductase [Clostridia bacterium]MDY6224177.1 pyrroline-5-carboxylate reductase [Christensenellaceae bacterium]
MFKIGFIGAGNMGGALAQAGRKALGRENVLVCDSSKERTEEAARRVGATASEREEICKTCRLIFLGVKPNAVEGVLHEIAPLLRQRQDPVALVSMAAGTPIAKIKSVSGMENVHVIRIMPNTPVKVGEGVIVYTPDAESTEEDCAALEKALSKAGITDKVTEKQLEAAGALSGCGPAFAYLFIEALADAGVECGLPRAAALKYAEQTVLGAAKTARDTQKHPAELKDEVCSPGGTTIAGVHALERSAFRCAAMDAVLAAYKKTFELSGK